MGRKRWKSPSRAQALAFFKTVAPSHFAILLLTILILITPVAAVIGLNAFLAFVYFNLFFFPNGPIGEHVEKVIIHLSMCAVGQAITFLTVCGTIWIDGNGDREEYSTDGSKALGACVLVLLCFLGGLFQSLYPRIKMAIRILLFSSTWTICTGARSIHSGIFTDHFYPAALAAGVSLFAALLIFPRSAQDDFAVLLVKTFNLTRALLDQSVVDFFAVSHDDLQRKPSCELVSLRKDLLHATTAIKLSFDDAQLEFNFGRVDLVAAKPLLSIVHRTKGWIHCGMGLGTRESQEKGEETRIEEGETSSLHASAENRMELESLQPSISRLLAEITSSICFVEASVELTMRGGSPRRVKQDERWNILYEGTGKDRTKRPGLALLQQRQNMVNAVEAFKGDLALVLKQLAASTSRKTSDHGKGQEAEAAPAGSGMFRSDIYDVAFLMASLVEIGKEMAGALKACQALVASWHAHDRKRLWPPSVSISSWLKGKLSHDGKTEAIGNHGTLEPDRHETFLYTEEGKEHDEQRPPSWTGWFRRPSVVQWRIRLSTGILSLKRSIHIRYGLKLAAGVALLSLSSWLPEARHWFQQERGVWLIVTYIWVLETSTGATIQVSLYRAAGTVAGAVWAIVAWYICGEGNRYGVGVFIVLAQLPASYFVIYTIRAQSLGLVFAFTQSVILIVPLLPFVDSSNTSVVHLGLVRAYQILLGIVAAFLVNMFVWPLHARVYLIHTISHITWQCSTVYLSLARQMLNHNVVIGPETSEKFNKLEEEIQLKLMASRDYLDIMHVEVSLIPKPIHTLSLLVKALQRIANLLVLLRKCREVALGIIQKEACFNVLNLRKELVSSILLSFWIIGQSLVTKERLPQFLPSCRGALDDLTDAMREQIDQDLLHVRLGGERNGDSDEATSLVPSSRAVIGTPRPAAAARISMSSSRRRLNRSGTTTPHSPRSPKVIDYSYFFVFAEHSLLSEIIFEVEKLLFLTKLLVGESSFIDSDYLPNDGGRSFNDHFDPRLVDSEEVNDFHQSMSEHGIDGRRLAAQLEAQLRASMRKPTSPLTPDG